MNNDAEAQIKDTLKSNLTNDIGLAPIKEQFDEDSNLMSFGAESPINRLESKKKNEDSNLVNLQVI